MQNTKTIATVDGEQHENDEHTKHMCLLKLYARAKKMKTDDDDGDSDG